MKAIIVIDVPVNDTVDFGHMDIRANVKVKAYNDLDFKTYELQHIKVEPIPERENALERLSEFGRGWGVGYNDCIDEILGKFGEEE